MQYRMEPTEGFDEHLLIAYFLKKDRHFMKYPCRNILCQIAHKVVFNSIVLKRLEDTSERSLHKYNRKVRSLVDDHLLQFKHQKYKNGAF